jgi:hypothetical protein
LAYKRDRRKGDWTVEEDRRLINCWAKGQSAQVIALQIDRTVSAIKKRRALLDLPKRKQVGMSECRVQISLDRKTFDAVKARADQRGQPVIDYIRMLIKRDLGF